MGRVLFAEHPKLNARASFYSLSRVNTSHYFFMGLIALEKVAASIVYYATKKC